MLPGDPARNSRQDMVMGLEPSAKTPGGAPGLLKNKRHNPFRDRKIRTCDTFARILWAP